MKNRPSLPTTPSPRHVSLTVIGALIVLALGFIIGTTSFFTIYHHNIGLAGFLMVAIMLMGYAIAAFALLFLLIRWALRKSGHYTLGRLWIIFLIIFLGSGILFFRPELSTRFGNTPTPTISLIAPQPAGIVHNPVTLSAHTANSPAGSMVIFHVLGPNGQATYYGPTTQITVPTGSYTVEASLQGSGQSVWDAKNSVTFTVVP